MITFIVSQLIIDYLSVKCQNKVRKSLDIQFNVTEKERRQKIFTFNKSKYQNDEFNGSVVGCNSPVLHFASWMIKVLV